MSILTRFIPLILLVLPISCSNYPPKSFAFPYTINSQDSAEMIVRSLADQDFRVDETSLSTTGRFPEWIFRGVGSVRNMEIDELQSMVAEDGVAGYSSHQVVRSHHSDREMATRQFIVVLTELRKDFGSPHYWSDGATCVVNELRSDTTMSRAMQTCRVDSIDATWRWYYDDYLYRCIELSSVDTVISIDFSGGVHH